MGMFDDPLSDEEIPEDEYFEPTPEWLYSLTGQVCIAAVRLDYYLVDAALTLTQPEPPRHRDVLDVLASPQQILGVVQRAGRCNNDAFNEASEEAHGLRRKRNSIVHAVVEWGDISIMYIDPRTNTWEETVTQGWSRQDPKPAGKPRPEQPLTNDVRLEMEKTLAEIQSLTRRVFELSQTL